MRDGKNSEVVSPPSPKTDIVRLRALWAGFVFYLILALRAISYVDVLPYQIVIAGGIFNFVIMGNFIYGIRRIYLRTGRWLPFRSERPLK
jgi:hypothetical protein